MVVVVTAGQQPGTRINNGAREKRTSYEEGHCSDQEADIIRDTRLYAVYNSSVPLSGSAGHDCYATNWNGTAKASTRTKLHLRRAYVLPTA